MCRSPPRPPKERSEQRHAASAPKKKELSVEQKEKMLKLKATYGDASAPSNPANGNANKVKKPTPTSKPASGGADDNEVIRLGFS